MSKKDTGPRLWDEYQLVDHLGAKAAAPFEKEVTRLEAAIEAAEQQLTKLRAERLLLDRRAKAAAEILAGVDLGAALAVQEYDQALRKLAAAPVRTQGHETYKDGRWVKTPSGARAWPLLVRDGATDEQIKNNLTYTGTTDYNAHALADGYKLHRGDLLRHESYRPILAGKKLVAEVRRVLRIPQPKATIAEAVKTALAAAGTKAKTKAAKPAKAAKADAKPAKAAKAKSPNLRTWCDQVRQLLSKAERKALGGRLRELQEWKDRHAAGMTPSAAAAQWRDARPATPDPEETIPLFDDAPPEEPRTVRGDEQLETDAAAKPTKASKAAKATKIRVQSIRQWAACVAALMVRLPEEIRITDKAELQAGPWATWYERGLRPLEAVERYQAAKETQADNATPAAAEDPAKKPKKAPKQTIRQWARTLEPMIARLPEAMRPRLVDVVALVDGETDAMADPRWVRWYQDGLTPAEAIARCQEEHRERIPEDPSPYAIDIDSTLVTPQQVRGSAGQIAPPDLAAPLSEQHAHEARIGEPVRIRQRLWAMVRELPSATDSEHPRQYVELQELLPPDQVPAAVTWGRRRMETTGCHASRLPLSGVECRDEHGGRYVFGSELLRIAMPFDDPDPAASQQDSAPHDDAPAEDPLAEIPPALVSRAREIFRETGRRSPTLLQRRLELPFSKACELYEAIQAADRAEAQQPLEQPEQPALAGGGH